MSPSLPRLADVLVVSNNQQLTHSLEKEFQILHLLVITETLGYPVISKELNQVNYIVVVIDEVVIPTNQSVIAIVSKFTEEYQNLVKNASKVLIVLLNHPQGSDSVIVKLNHESTAKAASAALVVSNNHFGSSIISENNATISALIKNAPIQMILPARYQKIVYPLPIPYLAKALTSYLFSFSGPQPVQEICGGSPLSVYNLALNVRYILAKKYATSPSIVVNPTLVTPHIFPYRLTVTLSPIVMNNDLEKWINEFPFETLTKKSLLHSPIKAKIVSKKINKPKKIILKTSNQKQALNPKKHEGSSRHPQLFFRLGVFAAFLSVVVFVLVIIAHFAGRSLISSFSNMHDRAILLGNRPLLTLTRSLQSYLPQMTTSALIKASNQTKTEAATILYKRQVKALNQSLLQIIPNLFKQNQPTSFFIKTNMVINHLLTSNALLQSNDYIKENQLFSNTLASQFHQLQLGTSYLNAYRWLNQGSHQLAIVVQDDAERRSSGGFISGIVFVSLENGRIMDITSKSVYTLDGDLNGQVTPPLTLSKALNESSWYLRDANWFISVPDAASSVAWFLEKEAGLSVDAVYFLNVSAVKRIFSVFHSLDIDNQVVTDANVNDFLNLKSSAADAPQSFHDHLVSLTFAVIKATQESLALDNQALAKTWWQILTSNHSSLNVYRNHTWQNISGVGDYTLLQCDAVDSIACQEQTIGFADNNVGLNRLSLNTLLQPTMQIIFKPTLFSVSQTVKVTNQNQNAYQTVLRFADLSQAINVSVSIDKNMLPASLFATDQESSLQVIDVPMQISANQTHMVKLSYDKTYSSSSTHTFAFKLVNQPGVGERHINLDLVNQTGKPWLISNQSQSAKKLLVPVDVLTDKTILVVFPSGV